LRHARWLMHLVLDRCRTSFALGKAEGRDEHGSAPVSHEWWFSAESYHPFPQASLISGRGTATAAKPRSEDSIECCESSAATDDRVPRRPARCGSEVAGAATPRSPVRSAVQPAQSA
jgi:hypothetical protein